MPTWPRDSARPWHDVNRVSLIEPWGWAACGRDEARPYHRVGSWSWWTGNKGAEHGPVMARPVVEIREQGNNPMIFDIVGWLGTGIVLTAYVLVSTGRIQPKATVYQVANVVAGVGLGLNALVNEAWPLVALNVVWAAVGIYNLTVGRPSLTAVVGSTEG